MVDKRRIERREKRKRSREEERIAAERSRQSKIEAWVPKTALGKRVKNGDLTSLEQVIDAGSPILEPEIVDFLVEDLQEKTMDLKKTARVIQSGRQFSYRATVLIGNGNGFVGVGIASDKERMGAAQKAANQARLNLVPVRRGCGSWECGCGTDHSLPFQVVGECGSVKLKLKPAPKGVGLVVGDNVKDVFRFAGVKDVWTESRGNTATRLNFLRAAIDALHQTMRMKVSDSIHDKVARAKREE